MADSGDAYEIAGVQLLDEALARTIDEGLAEVEALLHREVRSSYEFVTETSLHRLLELV